MIHSDLEKPNQLEIPHTPFRPAEIAQVLWQQARHMPHSLKSRGGEGDSNVE